MSITTVAVTSAVRRARRLLAGAAAAGLLVAGVPAVAQAAQGGSNIVLTPGSSTCIKQQANYQVRADGTATQSGARFALYRNGSVVDVAYGPVGAYAAERRTSLGNFPGSGTYKLCISNPKSTNTKVSFSLRTDGEF